VNDIQAKHEQMLYPTARLISRDTQGSGTIIYSKENNGKVTTMVLTNSHVIEDCIKIKKGWDPRYHADMKREHRNIVIVECFKFNNMSTSIGTYSVNGDIVAYNIEEDIALIELRDTINKWEYIARIFDPNTIDDIKIYEQVHVVGAALGEDPLPTEGILFTISKDIDDYRYWGCTAPSIYGTSGGGVYREIGDDYEWIGIPAMIRVHMTGFLPDPIPHLAYFIPPTRIKSFLDSNCYQFIYDDKYTVDQCNDMREAMRKSARSTVEAKMGVVSDDVDEYVYDDENLDEFDDDE